jgi:hypothetical protein
MMAAAIPAGWVLVPVDPTQEMLQAAFDVKGSHLYGLTYRAMLAAAPAAPAAEQHEKVSAYQKFCALRDRRRPGEEALQHTEKQAFEIATLESSWQPIETAPKDRHIIGYWNIYKRPCVMWWNFADEAFESFSDRNEYPSHWMPIPSNPV